MDLAFLGRNLGIVGINTVPDDSRWESNGFLALEAVCGKLLKCVGSMKYDLSCGTLSPTWLSSWPISNVGPSLARQETGYLQHWRRVFRQRSCKRFDILSESST